MCLTMMLVLFIRAADIEKETTDDPTTNQIANLLHWCEPTATNRKAGTIVLYVYVQNLWLIASAGNTGTEDLLFGAELTSLILT
jgi:hypothetical protein